MLRHLGRGQCATVGADQVPRDIHHFGWFQPGAFWEDLKFGIGPGIAHHSSWERMAIVSNADWIHHAMGVFGWMVPGEARVFPGAEMDAATAWVAGPEAV